MTTIAVDVKRKIIVADKRRTKTVISTNAIPFCEVEESQWVCITDTVFKIHPIKDSDDVIVGSGNASTIGAFANKWPNAVPIPEDDDTIILVLRQGEYGVDVIKYNAQKTTKRTWFGLGKKIKHSWNISFDCMGDDAIFIGSGRMFARGAFDAGASIEDSVKIASRSDFCTSDKIDVYDMKERKFAMRDEVSNQLSIDI